MSGKEYSMVNIAPTISAILGLPAPAQSKGKPIREIVADLTGCGRVAVLAPDALGMFAWNLWKSNMPYLSSLHARNSLTLRSIMPSKTPMNFATIVTGTDLAGHGIHSKKHDFACETLFDVIRKANGKSAGVGLNGYTGSELLARYADIGVNAGDGPDDFVVEKVIEIIDRDRPKFIIAQMGNVDKIFHRYGPSSPSVVPMLKGTDARLELMVNHLKPAGYGILILSDHGQHDVIDPPEGEYKGNHGTDSPEDCLVPCTWIGK